jgi:hypothetical protein
MVECLAIALLYLRGSFGNYFAWMEVEHNIHCQHSLFLSLSHSLPLSSEFSYNEVFLLWETIWTARLTVTQNFEEFLALAIMKQFK